MTDEPRGVLPIPIEVWRRPLRERIEWLLKKPVPVDDYMILAHYVVARRLLEECLE